MHRAAVVPGRQIALPPLVAVNETRLGCMRIQIQQQQPAVGDRSANNVGRMRRQIEDFAFRSGMRRYTTAGYRGYRTDAGRPARARCCRCRGWRYPRSPATPAAAYPHARRSARSQAARIGRRSPAVAGRSAFDRVTSTAKFGCIGWTCIRLSPFARVVGRRGIGVNWSVRARSPGFPVSSSTRNRHTAAKTSALRPTARHVRRP